MTMRTFIKALANRVPAAATVADYSGFAATHRVRAPREATRALVEQIRANGYAVVPDYWPVERCRVAIEQFETMVRDRPEHVQRHSDIRVFGAEALSPAIKEFHADPFIHALAEDYSGFRLVNAFTLANRVDSNEDSKGSGEGWHKDSSFRQFKAFIYLNDVDEGSGPLELIARSHTLGAYLRDMRAGGLAFRHLRISDDQLQRILSRDPTRLVTMVGKAGTLILADTASIHRGRPPGGGTRYALTNYFVEPWQITSDYVSIYKPVSPERILALVDGGASPHPRESATSA